jgi:hypothetical protein
VFALQREGARPSEEVRCLVEDLVRQSGPAKLRREAGPAGATCARLCEMVEATWPPKIRRQRAERMACAATDGR